MLVNNLRGGLPLEPRDRAGNLVNVGDTVIILEIPEWLVHDIPPNEAAVIRSCAASQMEVYDIDRHGYFWVSVITKETEDEYQCQRFIMEPNNVLKV